MKTGSANEDSCNARASWLYSFGASSAIVKYRKNKNVKFRISGDDASVVTGFTDRPERLTGQMTLGRFGQTFQELFGQDKPNASITHWGSAFENTIFTIKSIKYKSKEDEFVVKTDLLAGSSSPERKKFSDISFFIDSTDVAPDLSTTPTADSTEVEPDSSTTPTVYCVLDPTGTPGLDPFFGDTWCSWAGCYGSKSECQTDPWAIANAAANCPLSNPECFVQDGSA